jgi:hypothetical protein
MNYRMKFSAAMAYALALLVGLPSASGYTPAEAGHRDKSGTSGGPRSEAGSQAAISKALASRVSFQAEGMGLR